MSTTLAPRQRESYMTFRDKIQNEDFLKSLADTLPRHVTPDRMARVALTSIRTTPKLLDCTVDSVLAKIMEAAQLGWEIGGALGLAWLVPYGKECQLIPGYKGWLDLVRRSGQISVIKAGLVYDCDEFECQEIPPILRHRKARSGRASATVTDVYAWCRLKDGGETFECWSAEEINSHRDRYSEAYRYAISKGKDDTPWIKQWEWMAKKTVLKQLCKLLPMSIEGQQFVAREEQLEAGVIDGRVVRTDTWKSAMQGMIDGPSASQEDDEPPDETDSDSDWQGMIDLCKTVDAITQLESEIGADLTGDDLLSWQAMCGQAKERLAAQPKKQQKDLLDKGNQESE